MGAERGGKRRGQDDNGEGHDKIQRHDALDATAEEFRRCQCRAVGRIKNDEA
jgi:hypothetical protein